MSEAMRLVGSAVARERLWDVLEEAPVRLLALDTADIPGIRALMEKCAAVLDEPGEGAHNGADSRGGVSCR